MRTNTENFRNKGNILLTFILLLGLSAILLSYLYIVIARTTNTGNAANRSKALYIAEAGINKALWNLLTPVSSGGMGSTWRTTGSAEAFGGGQYTIIVADAPQDRITITATGEFYGIRRTLQQSLEEGTTSSSFFNYGVYSHGNISTNGSVNITGPVFADGDITLGGSSSINGDVFLTTGHTISEGTATIISPTPAVPTIDTTYFDGLLAAAAAASSGNMSISEGYALDGNTLYVNGDLSVSGSQSITGGGIIVVTGNYTHSGSGNIDSNTTIICANDLVISGSGSMLSGAVLYSANEIDLSGSGDITGAVLSSGAIEGSGSGRIIGVMYSSSLSMETELAGSRTVIGAVVSASGPSFSGSVHITYDATKIPSSIPGIVAGASGITVLNGSWKEL